MIEILNLMTIICVIFGSLFGLYIFISYVLFGKKLWRTKDATRENNRDSIQSPPKI